MVDTVPSVERQALRIAAGTSPEAAAGAPFTTIQKETLDAAQEALNNKKGADALAALASEFKNQATWEKTVTARIATERDAVTGEPQIPAGSAEQAKLQTSTDQIKTYLDLGTYGYDNLPDIPGGSDKATRQTELRAKVDTYVRTNPALFDALKDAAGNVPQPILEGLLRDPQITKTLIENLNTLTDPSIDTSATHKDLMTALENQARLSKAVPEKENERKAARKEKREAQKAKDAFDTDPADPGNPAGPKKGERLTVLAVNTDVLLLPHAQKEVEAATKALENHPNPAARGVLRSAQNELVRIQALPEVQEYSRLQKEKDAIEARLSKATTSVTEADKNVAAVQTELATADAQVALQKSLKQAESDAFVLNIDKAANDAMLDVVQKRAQEIINKLPEYKATAEKTAVEAQVLKIQNEFNARWITRKKNWLGQEVIKPNKEKATRDYKNLVTTGVDATIEGMLGDTGLSPEQIELIKKDDKLMAEYRKDVPAKIFAACTQSGHNFSEGEIRALASTSWFGETSKAWFASNKNVQKMLDQARENGVIKGFGQELMDKMGPAKYILLILLALGLAAAPALLGVGGIATGATLGGATAAAGLAADGYSRL